MYTIGTTDSEFDEILTDCCRWFLRKASISYFSCKAHELLFHLPYVSRTFGNTAPLSTFSFEASYQYILKGFSTKITRGFCETVCSRVLIANSVKREMKKRSENNPGPRLRKFFSYTSGYIKFVCDGFGQEFTEDLEASCTCAAREVLINLIDRIRKELKKLNYDTTTILHQLNHVIAQEADDIDRSLLDSTGPPIQRLLCLS
ncbi:hypothetical protein L3Y34_014040 [Caenorhabditis briggsae]|uniref:Uncharacterized protein n=1 Tax=Caenorhabditis briggsae TaxID=6238 RepID=A0AAE9IWT3_CAEBR|nr:hypothetical protein L3Y34_014040 [Caenorhabditis briggsae]